MFPTNSILAQAATTNVVLGSALPGPADAAGAVFRLAGALAVVLSILFAGVWAYRHWQRLAVRGAVPELRVAEVRNLGQRQALYLVECAGQRFLVGGSPAGLALLAPLPPLSPAPEPVPDQAPSPNPRSAPAPTSSFAEILVRALSRPA
jgi:flagellar biogenesis protein FliO